MRQNRKVTDGGTGRAGVRVDVYWLPRMVSSSAILPAVESICDQISAFADLPDDWDSYGATAPDAEVIACARGAVFALGEEGIQVSRATPGAGNNIEIAFRYRDVAFLVEMDDEDWQIRIQRADGTVEYRTIAPPKANNVHAVLDLA